MTANINEAIQTIKRVGPSNTRVVSMPGESVLNGNCQIEIRDGGNWHAVVTGLKQKMAEDLVAQATNRLICG